MKRSTLACLFLAAVSAAAQSSPQPAQEVLRAPASQSSCPVVFTSVALKSHAGYLPVRTDAPSSGNLDFGYQNQSGKPIQSIAVEVELTTKNSLYDLDATTATIKMLLSGNTIEAALPAIGYVYGISRVTLEQVIYTDGTNWNAGKQVCQYNKSGSPEKVFKVW